MEHCPESRGCRRDRSTWSFGHPILHQPMKTPELNLSSPAACLPGNFVNSFHPFLECEQQLLRHPVDSIRFLVIHCSATRCNQAYTARQLESDHRARGFRTTGYHFYIRRDGTLHHPRLLGEVGAHAKGFNRCSIGICYEGGLDPQGQPADTRTPQQLQRLLDLLSILKRLYPHALIVGHRDLNPHKACPCFDAAKEYGELTP